MAVVAMKRISICARKKDRDALLECLQRKGVLEISDTKSKQKIFYKEETTQKTESFLKDIQTAQNALEILEQYVPEKKPLFSMLEGRKEVEVKQYDSFAIKSQKIYEKAAKIIALSKEITERKGEQQKISLQIAAIEPWETLDVPFTETGTKTTSLFIGTLPGAWTEEKVLTLLQKNGPAEVQMISVQEEFTCLTVLVRTKQSEQAYEVLRANGFARPAVNSDLAPKEQRVAYNKEKESGKKQIEEAEKKIIESADCRDELQFFIDYETMRAEKYEQVKHLLQSAHTFLLTGYITAADAEKLKEEIESDYVAAVEIMEPKKKEEVPVILKNNGFASPLESVTEGFAAPGKGEMDPTFVMSLFYYLLFGIMFSDAGYGLILVIVCGILLHRCKHMESGIRGFVKMFFFCGVATAFCGFIFGSFFGDSVGVIAKSFFHSNVSLKPIWFSPNDNPMKMLVFSMLLGLLHLMTGLVMKFVNCVRNKKYQDAIFDSVFWIVLVISCVFILMSVQTFVEIIGAENQKLSANAGKVAAIVAGLSAVGILLTSGRESKNWFKRLLKGLYGVYGITGYLSDVLSYSRLLALGLATGVIGSVVNSMGVMSENIVVRAILFVFIFLIGHVMNFLINILGAYVHTNRLQYVEFFGKFYDGGGRMFQPFCSKTKYFVIKESKHE